MCQNEGGHLCQVLTHLLARSALDRQGLTVREAESRTGNAAADFSRLRQGQLERFSIERLLDMASRLGERLTLTVARPGEAKAMAPKALAVHLKSLRALCRRFMVRRLSAFGSVLGSDFDPARSDIWRWSSGPRGATDPRTSTSNSRRRWNVWWGVRSTW